MSTYERVHPPEHDPDCTRGKDRAHPGRLDLEHCPRCRALWERIGGDPHYGEAAQ